MRTQGRWLLAEIRIEGQVLGVMDEFGSDNSNESPDERWARGLGFTVSPQEWARSGFEFTDSSVGGGEEVSRGEGLVDGWWWEKTFGGNPECVKRLVRTGDWSYEGLGQIVSVHPTVVDFGLLSLEMGDELSYEQYIGEYVSIPISRLVLRMGDSSE